MCVLGIQPEALKPASGPGPMVRDCMMAWEPGGYLPRIYHPVLRDTGSECCVIIAFKALALIMAA